VVERSAGIERGAHVGTSDDASFVEWGTVECITDVERGRRTVVESTATSSAART
jgi:hypothetical protein